MDKKFYNKPGLIKLSGSNKMTLGADDCSTGLAVGVAECAIGNGADPLCWTGWAANDTCNPTGNYVGDTSVCTTGGSTEACVTTGSVATTACYSNGSTA